MTGVELTGPERSIVRWLAGWDDPTVAVLAGLFARCRATPGGAP
jgi:hypothetical protein